MIKKTCNISLELPCKFKQDKMKSKKMNLIQNFSTNNESITSDVVNVFNLQMKNLLLHKC